MELLSKRASDWTLDDLQAVVDSQLPESVLLELKQDLPLGGDAAGWRAKQRIHASERDGLAKEIVALANAYGGVLLVGVQESEDAPKRAAAVGEALPNVHDLADRLRSSLGAYIDPPIPGLEIAALPLTDGGEGFLVVSVPASGAGPHGYGRPPQVFMRRDDRSEPATMRDVHNMFWEARSLRERIDSEFAVREKQLLKVAPNKGDLGFQFVAISERPLQLLKLPSEVRAGNVIKQPSQFQRMAPASAAEFPSSPYNWRPTATGVEYWTEDSASRLGTSAWEIDESGIICVTGTNNLRVGSDTTIKQFFPGWYAKTAGSLVGLTKIVSGWSGYEGNWIVAGRFLASSAPLQPSSSGSWDSFESVDLTDPQGFRPLRVTADLAETQLDEIAARVWACFGIIRPETDTSLMSGVREALQFM